MTDDRAAAAPLSWAETLTAFRQPRVIALLLLGFSAGLPILLIFSSLSVWLREADVDRATVTLFSWAALGYSFKFVWAPIVDRLPLPLLSRALGRRRGWLLLSQCAVIAAIALMGLNDPRDGLVALALAAVLLGFSSATQDIVIDAYRIEAADERLQALLSASYIAGYRIGMLVAGAGALKLAAALGTTDAVYVYDAWRVTYLAMAAAMLIGIATTLAIREPDLSGRAAPLTAFAGLDDYLRFLALFVLAVGALIAAYAFGGGRADAARDALEAAGWVPAAAGFASESARLTAALTAAFTTAFACVRLGVVRREMLHETYIEPVLDFFRRFGAASVLILLLIGSYRVSDIVLGVISNVFYLDVGFDKDQIANVTKAFGLLMTLLGGFIGGVLALRFGVLRVLMLGAVLSAATNLLFVVLAQIGNDIVWLFIVIGADNVSAGIAGAAFVAYLSSLTNVSFTAMQYAIFSSLMTLLPKVLGGYSGAIVDDIGYQRFFLLTAALGVPVLVLIVLVARSSRIR